MVHSSWPSRAMWGTHAPTFNKWHKKKENNKNEEGDTPHVTHGAKREYGLTSMMVCTNDKFDDIRETIVTIGSEI